MLQEDRNALTSETQDIKRVIDSIREEFDAIDVYRQRADACADEQLKKIMLHNRKEELEHVAMLLEWLRQHDPEAGHEFKDYLFGDTEDIAGKEH